LKFALPIKPIKVTVKALKQVQNHVQKL